MRVFPPIWFRTRTWGFVQRAAAKTSFAFWPPDRPPMRVWDAKLGSSPKSVR